MSEVEKPRPHWLFAPGDGEPSCLCILELPGGEYWVVDSPTGTYRSGHADRGKWRQAEQGYLAQGYIPEAAAKAQGLITGEWTRAVPSPEQGGRRRAMHAVGLLFVIAVLAAMLAVAIPRIIATIFGW